MKALVNAGTYEILTPIEQLKAQLRLIERAGRSCYQSHAGKGITDESAMKFAGMLLRRGHESVIEHSSLTVVFQNLSRGFTHEAVRHRLSSPSQESTRYVDYAPKSGTAEVEENLDAFDLQCVLPPHRDADEVIPIVLPEGHPIREMGMTPIQMFEMYEACYRGLRKSGWRPEDARQFLPIGTKSELVITANLREWRHIMKMRTTKPAHWEIRRVMCSLLEALKLYIPVIFSDFVLAGTDNNGVAYYEKLDKVPKG